MDVTTIIPVRNRARFIGSALRSIAEQTRPSKKIIVVDDASTDDTREVVSEIAASMPNLTLLALEKNVGAPQARNLGVEHATTELVAFLDSDDVWLPRKLEKQIPYFEQDPAVVAVFSGSRVIYPDRSFAHMPPERVTINELYFSNALSSTSSAVVLRSAFRGVGGFDVSLPSCQDWDLFLRLARVGELRTVQEELIEFINHKGERISNNRASILNGHRIVNNRIYGMISDPRLLSKVRGSHHMTLADIFSSLIYEPVKALQHAVTGIRLARSQQSVRILARVLKRVALRA